MVPEHWLHASTRWGRGSSLESPHNSVHVALGWPMTSVAVAAFDPAFWLHHCNVDRIYEGYLQVSIVCVPTPEDCWGTSRPLLCWGCGLAGRAHSEPMPPTALRDFVWTALLPHPCHSERRLAHWPTHNFGRGGEV